MEGIFQRIYAASFFSTVMLLYAMSTLLFNILWLVCFELLPMIMDHVHSTVKEEIFRNISKGIYANLLFLTECNLLQYGV